MDYIGNWAGGTTYKQGDVVRYNNVDYLAVNPSTGQTPPSAVPLADAGWTLMPLVGAWTLLSGWPAPRFRRLSSGLVIFRGLANGGATGSIMFTLPVGYRPGDNIRFLVNNSWRADSIEVATNGNVTAQNRNDNGWLDTGSISFYAEG